MDVLVGLGEGIGNVVMGLPLLDAVAAAGHTPWLHLRPTPDSVRNDLADLVRRGRDRLIVADDDDLASVRFGAACLTHWWISRPGRTPDADEVFIGGAPNADEPEILANLDAASVLAPAASPRAVIRSAASAGGDPRQMVVGIHPGCKPDPEWKARKVYPRWAEVTHRLKDLGARVVVLGTETDDAYCGEPHEDLRGRTTLLEAADRIAGLDVLVSGDSGLHHVAVALGVPTVALFGASSAVKASHPDALVVPVVFGPCETAEAFAQIEPLAVARAAVGWRRAVA